ncbi:MAG: phosphatase PAP2 family protein [Scardovia wiggsiae]|nr:phosphatase PAP2 family protein [Scardovia wiggsiae]
MTERIHYTATRAKYPSSVHPVRTALPLFFLAAGGLVAVIDTILIFTHASQGIDSTVLTTMVAFRFNALVKVAQAFTAAGSIKVTIALVAVAAVALWFTKHRTQAYVLAGAVATSAAFTWAVKIFVHRGRPDLQYRIGQVEDPYSFPSGHSLNSTVFYGTLAVIALYSAISMAKKTVITILCTLMPLLIGIGRLYLAHHWFTDVLAGWAVGIAWVGIVGLVYARLEQRAYKRSQSVDSQTQQASHAVHTPQPKHQVQAQTQAQTANRPRPQTSAHPGSSAQVEVHRYPQHQPQQSEQSRQVQRFPAHNEPANGPASYPPSYPPQSKN